MKNLHYRGNMKTTRSLLLLPGLLAILATGCSTNTKAANTVVPSTATTQVAQHSGHGNMENNPTGGMNHGSSHNMDLGPADDSLDLRFIDGMTPHHQGALVMAKEVLQKSQRPELRKFANQILADQQKEISQMQKWRKTWYPKAGSELMGWHAEGNHMMPMTAAQIAAMRMDRPLGKADKEFDLRFLDAMIPHHAGAVQMAKELQQKSKRPEMVQLAKAIITSQQSEIDKMKQWRKAWYGK
jgi:uncharacterized protein (DUF305 family)